jgi:signal transduction histidine kinase
MMYVEFVIIIVLACAIPIAAYFSRRQCRRQFNARVEELSKLTGGLAHEIKNPLSTVKVNLKLISEDLDRSDPKQSRSVRKLAVVQKETDRLEQILDDFLRYTGRVELQCADTDLNEIVTDMVDFFSPQAYTNGITVRAGLCDGPLLCRLDKVMIKQVLLNMFLNAQQAMAKGGELLIRTARRKGSAVVEICDTGVGIEKDKIERIFDAYYSSRPSGSGLGLPTARKIIAQHGGEVTVASELGKGTIFTIRLPLLC